MLMATSLALRQVQNQYQAYAQYGVQLRGPNNGVDLNFSYRAALFRIIGNVQPRTFHF